MSVVSVAWRLDVVLVWAVGLGARAPGGPGREDAVRDRSRPFRLGLRGRLASILGWEQIKKRCHSKNIKYLD